MCRKETEALRKESMELYGFGPETMKHTRVCTQCGTATTADTKTCTVCGAALPEETLYDLYTRRHLRCPYCHAILKDLSNYCPQCGAALSKNIMVKEER